MKFVALLALASAFVFSGFGPSEAEGTLITKLVLLKGVANKFWPTPCCPRPTPSCHNPCHTPRPVVIVEDKKKHVVEVVPTHQPCCPAPPRCPVKNVPPCHPLAPFNPVLTAVQEVPIAGPVVTKVVEKIV